MTFDIDANGILNVSAEEKSTGKKEKITITNDNGRLSASEIQRMVDDAEKFKQEDEKQRQRIAARNGLETYCLNMQSTVEDARLDNKINKNDKNSIMDKVNEVIEWLDRTQIGDEDEYKDKQKEIEQVCNPIMTKMYRDN